MKTCKYPKCNKQLVGKEKFMCKSCSDKIKDGAKKAGAVVGGLALTAAAIVIKSKSDDNNA
jgi:hypothetical protein